HERARSVETLQVRLIGSSLQGFSLEWYFSFGPQRAQVVLDRGLQVLIYAGDPDNLRHWFGNQAWTNALPWAHRAECNEKSPGHGVSEMSAQCLGCSDIHTMELWWTSTHARAKAATIAACAVRGSVVHFSGHQATEAAIKLTSLATFAGEQGTSSIK
ncbi:hypothetical protein FOZ63_011170, partial [Perkinsus olseni]